MATHLWKWRSLFIPESSSQHVFFIKFWNEPNCEPLLSQPLPGGWENSNGYEQFLLSYKWKQEFNTRYLNHMKTTFLKCLNLLKESVYGLTKTAQNFLKRKYPPTSNASTAVRWQMQLPHSAIDQEKIQKVSYIVCVDFHTCLSCMRLKDIKIETQFTVLFGYTWYRKWLRSGFDARWTPKKPVYRDARSTINHKGNPSIPFSKTCKGAPWAQPTSPQRCTYRHLSTCYESHPICPRANSTQVISKNQKTKAIAHMGKKNNQDFARFWEAARFMHLNIALLFISCILKEKLSGRE